MLSHFSLGLVCVTGLLRPKVQGNRKKRDRESPTNLRPPPHVPRQFKFSHKLLPDFSAWHLSNLLPATCGLPLATHPVPFPPSISISLRKTYIHLLSPSLVGNFSLADKMSPLRRCRFVAPAGLHNCFVVKGLFTFFQHAHYQETAVLVLLPVRMPADSLKTQFVPVTKPTACADLGLNAFSSFNFQCTAETQEARFFLYPLPEKDCVHFLNEFL